MENVPVFLWSYVSDPTGGGLVTRLGRAVATGTLQELRPVHEPDSYFLQRVAAHSRVIIIEGISGSGKDTLQAYLKNQLTDREVYDYSEGEVLHSWKQLQIQGVSKIRVKFMKLFVKYIKHVVTRDNNAVFLLNRFHLSTFASTVVQQPKLEREYDEIIGVLRTLPVHVLILHLDENEIHKRSSHPERSRAWKKFQQQIIGTDSFRDRLAKQQRLILEAAKKQHIPYSVIKLLYEPALPPDKVHISNERSLIHTREINAADLKPSRRKRAVPEPV